MIETLEGSGVRIETVDPAVVGTDPYDACGIRVDLAHPVVAKTEGIGGIVSVPDDFPCAWIEDGETLVSIAQGGGGYGDPTTRDPERVCHDVREGLVSRERAAEVYAVAIGEDGEIDHDKTAELRGG